MIFLGLILPRTTPQAAISNFHSQGSIRFLFPRGSKYPILEVSGSKNHTPKGIWDQKPPNIGYLDPLGSRHAVQDPFFLEVQDPRTKQKYRW